MIEVFKIINGIYDPLTTVDMFELNTTSNTRGHSKKMKIKTSRLNVRKYTFVVRIVEIWNSLPESVIQAKTAKKFEIGLDEHWKHQECKYDFTANINNLHISNLILKLYIHFLRFYRRYFSLMWEKVSPFHAKFNEKNIYFYHTLYKI